VVQVAHCMLIVSSDQLATVGGYRHVIIAGAHPCNININLNIFIGTYDILDFNYLKKKCNEKEVL